MNGFLAAWNQTPGQVGAVAGPRRAADLAVVANQAIERVPAGSVSRDPEGPLRPPTEVTAELHATDAVRIHWRDATTAEIGYRVDRRIGDGPWTAIAYRPPQITGHPHNQPEWIDFLAPTARDLRYRVVAIRSDDGDAGASPATAPLQVPHPRPAKVP